jgi:predicted protein tyrosine phosphatase
VSSLWICGVTDVINYVEQHNIKKIISCLTDYEIVERMYHLAENLEQLDEQYWKNPSNWLKLEIHDTSNEAGYKAPNYQEVLKGITFGGNVIKSGQPLLVHCQFGLSRSPAMAIGCLLQAGRTIEQAYNEVLAVRPTIDPNTLIISILDSHFKFNGELIKYNQEIRSRYLSKTRKTYMEMTAVNLGNPTILAALFEHINQLNKLDRS